MLVEKAEMPATESAQRASFFRQSGWLMIANVTGGVMMYAVHLLNRFLPEGYYGAFGVSLAVVMLVPTIPLQMVLAQQTAKALATNRTAELAAVIRWTWLVTSAVWLVGAMAAFVWQNEILAYLKIQPAVLWMTLALVLLSLWMPIFWGLLQGKQNFLWLGWSMMSNAVGRVGLAAFAVIVLHAYAVGMISGVLFGMVVASVLGAWHSRSLWRVRAEPFDWRSLLHQIIPLFIGFLGFQMLFTADTVLVKGYFSKAAADYYVAAGTMSRALMWLVLPLASVMFPRIVHSAVRSEKTNLMNLVLLGTAVLAIVGAIGLSVIGPLVVRMAYPHPENPEFIQVVCSLLPWYGAAMVPLALANVLLNNLLARPASKLVPALCVLGVALAYLFALTRFHGSMIMVLQTMGLLNLLLFGICAWFTWFGKSQGAVSSLESPESV
jgi:O-antigen/teichoic acid export membrane protein